MRAGERKLHATVPFLAGAGCLALLGAYVDHNPAAAFAALLGATVLWGPAGIIYGLPAMFLQARPASAPLTLVGPCLPVLPPSAPCTMLRSPEEQGVCVSVHACTLSNHHLERCAAM